MRITRDEPPKAEEALEDQGKDGAITYKTREANIDEKTGLSSLYIRRQLKKS